MRIYVHAVITTSAVSKQIKGEALFGQTVTRVKYVRKDQGNDVNKGTGELGAVPKLKFDWGTGKTIGPSGNLL